MKLKSSNSHIGLFFLFFVFAATALAPLVAQDDIPVESTLIDSIQFKNLINNKTHTIFAGQKVKIKMTDGRKLKGLLVRQEGNNIIIKQQDFELAIDLALVAHIKAKNRGLVVAGGVALITTGIAAIFASGLAAIVAVLVIAFTGEGASIFLVAAGLLVGGVGSTVLGNSLLKEKTDLQGDWRLSS